MSRDEWGFAFTKRIEILRPEKASGLRIEKRSALTPPAIVAHHAAAHVLNVRSELRAGVVNSLEGILMPLAFWQR